MLYLIFELLDVSHLITAAFNFISSFITTFPGVVDIGIKGQRGGLRNYTGLVREMFEDLHFYRVHLRTNQSLQKVLFKINSHMNSSLKILKMFRF